MIRTLYPTPGPVDYDALAAELAAVHPILGVNQVETSIAVYTDTELDTSDQAAIGVVIANHVPPAPQVDPVVVLAHAILDATTLDDVKPVAAQILSDAGVQP
jgi:hypothetical protein